MTPNLDIQKVLEEALTEYVSATMKAIPLIEDSGEKLGAARALANLLNARDRDAQVSLMSFGPDSLVGSYFRAPDQDDPNAEAEWLSGEPCQIVQGQIVGQPFASSSTTMYLVEFWGRDGSTGRQQLVEIDRMLNQRWAFYDTEGWLKMAEPVQTKSTVEEA